jgi:hypothetical protein
MAITLRIQAFSIHNTRQKVEPHHQRVLELETVSSSDILLKQGRLCRVVYLGFLGF